MQENINIIRCTCDVCKKTVDINKGENNPLYTLVLPVDYISETGGFEGVTTSNVEVCKDCLIQMKNDICEHYEAKVVRYGGLQISRQK